MPDNLLPRLVTVGGDSRVLAGDAELMRITVGDLYMGGTIIIGHIRFRPGGPLRIANLVNCWRSFVPKRHPEEAHVRAEQTEQGLRLHVEPDTRGGVADVENYFDFLPDPQAGGWMIEHRCRIILRRRVDLRQLGVIAFADERGHDAFWWEIDDPNFDGNYGPSVPMQNDWLGVYEPNCGPDTFRKHWRRQVETFIFSEPAGRVRTIRFHRGMLFCLSRHNQRALPLGAWAGVRHRDGAGTLVEFSDGQPTFGHLCEWGFDTHFWRRIEARPGQPILPQGHQLQMTYRLRELPREAMDKRLHCARPIEPTEREWLGVANVPIYEEPVNHFATSWRDEKAGDAWPWIPGAGATWDRKVGRRRPGSLRLETPREALPTTASWESIRVGASNFMNPLVPGARYRLTGFVRVEPGDGPGLPTPSLSIRFHKYAGPGTFAPEITPCEVVTSQGHARVKSRQWSLVEVLSPPVNGHVMGATLACHLHGRGVAWFDEIAFEKLD